MEEDAEISTVSGSLEPALDFELGGSDDLWDFDSNNLDFNEDLSGVFDHTVGFIVY